jgi:hypothetical protein
VVVVNLPEGAKPAFIREVTSACSGWTTRGERGQRASKDLSGTWETCSGGGEFFGSRHDSSRESITAIGPEQESEGVIVVMKRRNFRGTKGPCRTHGTEEVMRTAWGNPTTE